MKRAWAEILLWVRAIRFYAHSASILPVVLGSLYAWQVTGEFHVGRFLLALLASMLYHAGCNLTNDYYDVKYGMDRPGTYGGSGVLLRGEMIPQKMMSGIVALFAFGTVVGLWLVALCGTVILWLGVVGLLAAVFYTASRFSAKANALGEPLVFLMMGVAMTAGGYAVQTGEITWPVVWISLPISFLVTAILTANNIRDLADDRVSGIKTIPLLLGAIPSRMFFSSLLFASYPVVVVLAWARLAPWHILLAWLTLPMAVKLHRLFWAFRGEKHEELKDTPAETAKLHMAFNTLMCLGLWLGRWL